MLSLHKHTLDIKDILSTLAPRHTLEMGVVRADDDALIQSIDQQYTSDDQQWRLEPAPDVLEIDKFWDGVNRDLHNDPEWVSFDDD